MAIFHLLYIEKPKGIKKPHFSTLTHTYIHMYTYTCIHIHINTKLCINACTVMVTYSAMKNREKQGL